MAQSSAVQTPNSFFIVCLHCLPTHRRLRSRSVLQRSVEVDGEVGAVAEWLVVRVTAAAEGHLVGMRNLAAVDVCELDRARHQVRAVLAGGDVDVSHPGSCPFSKRGPIC